MEDLELGFKRPLVLATREAYKSSFRHRVGAVVLKKGRVVSRGFNSVTTHRLLRSKYGHFSIHAECAALLKRAPGDTIVVVRVRRDGRLGMSRPCSKCMAMIKECNIRYVVYVDNSSSARKFKVL